MSNKTSKSTPSKGGRYYKVDGKLIPEAQYEAAKSNSSTKGKKS